jgi:hypothetical protein
VLADYASLRPGAGKVMEFVVELGNPQKHQSTSGKQTKPTMFFE